MWRLSFFVFFNFLLLTFFFACPLCCVRLEGCVLPQVVEVASIIASFVWSPKLAIHILLLSTCELSAVVLLDDCATFAIYEPSLPLVNAFGYKWISSKVDTM